MTQTVTALAAKLMPQRVTLSKNIREAVYGTAKSSGDPEPPVSSSNSSAGSQTEAAPGAGGLQCRPWLEAAAVERLAGFNGLISSQAARDQDFDHRRAGLRHGGRAMD
jgi:hypothetical protein